MKYIFLSMMMVFMSPCFADSFQSVQNLYQTQYDKKIKQQEQSSNEQLKQMIALQQKSFVRLDHQYENIKPVTETTEGTQAQYVTQIYLPPEPPTFMDSVKSSLPNLLIKGLLLGL